MNTGYTQVDHESSPPSKGGAYGGHGILSGYRAAKLGATAAAFRASFALFVIHFVAFLGAPVADFGAERAKLLGEFSTARHGFGA